MTTKTMHYCDRCGAESKSRLPNLSLRYDDLEKDTEIVVTREAELCMKCHAALQELLREFYPQFMMPNDEIIATFDYMYRQLKHDQKDTQ